jgi:hypothetical protein
MSRVNATVHLDHADLLYEDIRAVTGPEYPPLLILGSVTVTVDKRAAQPVEIADAVLAAVTEWHAEIHRRGHAEPVGEPRGT